MQSKVGWYIPQKIIYIEYPSNLDVSTLIHLQEQVIVLLNEVDHPVYVVSNLTNIETYPVNVSQIKTVVELIRHPNNIAINVNKNRAIKFISSMVPKLLRSQLPMKDFLSIREAVAYIKSQDSSIDWSSANKDLADLEALSA